MKKLGSWHFQTVLISNLHTSQMLPSISPLLRLLRCRTLADASWQPSRLCVTTVTFVRDNCHVCAWQLSRSFVTTVTFVRDSCHETCFGQNRVLLVCIISVADRRVALVLSTKNYKSNIKEEIFVYIGPVFGLYMYLCVQETLTAEQPHALRLKNHTCPVAETGRRIQT